MVAAWLLNPNVFLLMGHHKEGIILRGRPHHVRGVDHSLVARLGKHFEGEDVPSRSVSPHVDELLGNLSASSDRNRGHFEVLKGSGRWDLIGNLELDGFREVVGHHCGVDVARGLGLVFAEGLHTSKNVED